ncbi:pyridoxamine 5'-phosphate oxidase family protein [Lactobacillus agrestimuris]|uniref:pyridoxamine 5'-phosphate oxidase family protein n=1 Tax=Lactobacillus agrestimuris TaxID=2941328 RepID=UPI0019C96BC9|nr:pyridoxamine 5'-phosphate oxidase family protein [Lactobacillus agrestimuris]MBD5431213.1 pyridoxamine 5'-phosphate oxidase family protein [Lactobacillus sp.]
MKKLDSNKLTQAQQDFFKDHLAFLSTVDSNGMPQVGPKQSMKVVDDSHLAYLEKTQQHAFENIKNGSKVAVVVADKPSHTNVRVIGTAEIQDKDENGWYPVTITIEEIDE